jgi:purine-nucleoside phosphorylase
LRMRDESRAAADIIRERTGSAKVDVGLVVGAGLAGVADQATETGIVDYGDLPGFSASPHGDQPAQCIVGKLGSARVAILKGRAYYHERGDVQCMRVPLEALKLLGAESVIIIGIAGSLKKELFPGAFVAVRDHINLTGVNPLIGSNGDSRGLDLTGTYDPHLRQRFSLAASEVGRKTGEGTLMWFPGPNYETPAEVNAARILGADMVGMSIVPEAVIARALGLRVLAVAMVTNFAAGMSADALGREQNTRVASASATPLTRILAKLFERWVIDTRR